MSIESPCCELTVTIVGFTIKDLCVQAVSLVRVDIFYIRPRCVTSYVRCESCILLYDLNIMFHNPDS